MKAQLFFLGGGGSPPIENKLEQTIQTLRWHLAKVAFDAVRQKAVAFCGFCSEVPEEDSGENLNKINCKI